MFVGVRLRAVVDFLKKRCQRSRDGKEIPAYCGPALVVRFGVLGAHVLSLSDSAFPRSRCQIQASRHPLSVGAWAWRAIHMRGVNVVTLHYGVRMTALDFVSGLRATHISQASRHHMGDVRTYVSCFSQGFEPNLCLSYFGPNLFYDGSSLAGPCYVCYGVGPRVSLVFPGWPRNGVRFVLMQLIGFGFGHMQLMVAIAFSCQWLVWI